MMPLSNREREDYIIEDPDVLQAYANLHGVCLERVWAEDVPYDVWVYLEQREAQEASDDDDIEE